MKYRIYAKFVFSNKTQKIIPLCAWSNTDLESAMNKLKEEKEKILKVLTKKGFYMCCGISPESIIVLSEVVYCDIFYKRRWL